MRFEFNNLGTIKGTTLDFRPLTVIIGPNNTNKTYLAYCVHGLLKSIAAGSILEFVSNGRAEVAVDLADLVAGARKVTEGAARRFSKGLPEYFQDTYGDLFKETTLGFDIDDRDVRAVSPGLVADNEGILKVVDQKIVINVPSSNEAIKRQVVGFLVDDILGRLSRVTLTLPAERNAFIMTYKVLSARRYRVLRDRGRSSFLQRRSTAADEARDGEIAIPREQGDIRYPAPIEDFLDFLTDVEIDAARPRNDANNPFGKVARLIEEHIQAGHRTGYESRKLGGTELALTVSDRLRIDLYNASSSIKQIAPLLLYLRYRAAPNQTLIIDEPEMNLHPEGQAKLLEALGMLANLGVHVLLTTHSPYFMAHLNNLIASDQSVAARKKRQAKHLYIGDPAAFLSPDDVSAYEMRPEGLVSLADPEYGIRWDTLSDVSSELQRRYFAIVEEPKGRGKAK